jgi:hypothetical protein
MSASMGKSQLSVVESAEKRRAKVDCKNATWFIYASFGMSPVKARRDGASPDATCLAAENPQANAMSTSGRFWAKIARRDAIPATGKVRELKHEQSALPQMLSPQRLASRLLKSKQRINHWDEN